MSTTTIIHCDIKDCKCTEKVSKKKIQVIFLSDQTEGRNCEPYLSDETFDICSKCLEHILKGNYLYGYGAQGHNTYYFKTKK